MMNSYEKGRREFLRWLTGYGIRLARLDDLGMARDADGWEHFSWSMTIENWRGAEKTSYAFPFRQGTGHTKKPALVDLMGCLLLEGFVGDL